MIKPKPYQIATVEAALEVLRTKSGRPRFLVADEVGLGKTVVAQQIIKKMTKGRRKPLVVYYVCSSLTIAAQNRRKLVEAVAPGAEAETAVCTADRLSMLPFGQRPTHDRVHLYTLTPDTSLPSRKGRRRDGRKEERALIYHMVERCWPGLFKRWMFRRSARRHWKDALKWAEGAIDELKGKHDLNLGKLTAIFREKVREQFGLAPGVHVPAAIRQRFDFKQDSLTLISKLRAALIECALDLDGIQPDLVIFDEFQRFRELVQPEIALDGSNGSDLDRVAKRLRGDSGRCTPLLLLSATPYSLYSQRDEQELFGNHHDELLNLLCFLFGDGAQGRERAQRAKDLFTRFATLLRAPRLDFGDIEEKKDQIEGHLSSVMSRTERAQIEAAVEVSSQSSPRPVPVETERADWQVFRHLSERLPMRYNGAAVTYWRSVPLPMQTLGNGYVVWRSANAQSSRTRTKVPAFRPGDAQNAKKVHWPHPKLRKLVSDVEPETLCLPWKPPSLPWWPLDKRWTSAAAQQGKLLVFSRFRATPKIVAAALSHEARSWAARTGRLPGSRTNLPLKAERMPVVALFYPSLWLAEACEPLQAVRSRAAVVYRAAERQLGKYLTQRGVAIKKSQPAREFWRLLAGLEGTLDGGLDTSLANRDVPEEVRKLWRQATQTPIASISTRELRLLTKHALGAPGVVITRSLRRHFSSDDLRQQRGRLLDFCLFSWRNYFDNPVFVAALKKRNGSYPNALQDAVFHGNLEAVLDEQIWYLAQGGVVIFKDMVQSLGVAVGVIGGRVKIHRPDNAAAWFQSHSDVALPLAQELEPSSPEDNAQPLRADQIRTAFNSPFWPFVLTTTSIGQEGLDFHPWCKTLLHWDLPSNPVDLEQREGRIKRFAGLAVRQAMAQDKGDDALAQTFTLSSPWGRLQTLVDQCSYGDDSGLQPWWHYQGASVDTRFYHMLASEEIHHLAQLKQQRAIYRLALGQQHQVDFVRMVRTKDPVELKRLVELTPNFSAWSRKQRKLQSAAGKVQRPVAASAKAAGPIRRVSKVSSE